jgi:hypothetical protein
MAVFYLMHRRAAALKARSDCFGTGQFHNLRAKTAARVAARVTAEARSSSAAARLYEGRLPLHAFVLAPYSDSL